MDHTDEPSTKVLLPTESTSDNTTNASERICTVSEHAAIWQPQNDPMPSTLESLTHSLSDKRLEDAGASTTPSPHHCHCPCALTNKTERKNPDGHEVFRSFENDPLANHGVDTDRRYSEISDISDISSQGHEPLEKLDSVPGLVVSEDGYDSILVIDSQSEASAVSYSIYQLCVFARHRS
jgi:hypothetical protein